MQRTHPFSLVVKFEDSYPCIPLQELVQIVESCTRLATQHNPAPTPHKRYVVIVLDAKDSEKRRYLPSWQNYHSIAQSEMTAADAYKS